MASQVAATWRFNPATMHGGVQWFCPAMHGDGAKRLRFEKFLGSGIFFKFVLKMTKNKKKIRAGGATFCTATGDRRGPVGARLSAPPPPAAATAAAGTASPSLGRGRGTRNTSGPQGTHARNSSCNTARTGTAFAAEIARDTPTAHAACPRPRPDARARPQLFRPSRPLGTGASRPRSARRPRRPTDALSNPSRGAAHVPGVHACRRRPTPQLLLCFQRPPPSGPVARGWLAASLPGSSWPGTSSPVVPTRIVWRFVTGIGLQT